MKPVFPTYIIKTAAKRGMRGRLFKAMAVCFLPIVIISAVSLILIALVPGAADSFDLVAKGDFESLDARMEYFNTVTDNYIMAISAVSVLFSFVTVGSEKVCLDIVRGKDFKIRDVFCFYDKWYIAAIYPLFVLVLPQAVGKGFDMLAAMGVNALVTRLLATVFDIAMLVVSCKLIFIDYYLADNDCKSIVRAVKSAWKMTGFNTVMNIIILTFSFIGWIILCTITSGLVLIYVYPYMMVSIAALYDMNKQYNEQHN